MAEEKQNLKDTLIAAGKQFLLSPAGKAILSQLAVASGVVDVVAFLDDARQVQKLIDENTPVIKTFSTKGRLYNKATNEPAVGIEVKPQLALLPMVLETKTRKVKIPDPSGGKNVFIHGSIFNHLFIREFNRCYKDQVVLPSLPSFT